MINSIFLLLLFSIFSNGETTNLSYSIIQKEKVVGYTNAYKYQEIDQTTYRSNSVSTVKAIISIDIVSNYEITLENGLLRSAEANVLVRNRPYTHSYTYYCENQCEMAKDGANVIYIGEDISYASTMLLFEEPVNITQSYSELDGSFHSIRKVGNHRYEKKDANDRINTYQYVNGILQYAEIDAGLISFELKLNH